MSSTTTDKLVRQILAAMLQRRHFDSSLVPSPHFPGFSASTITTMLAAIPRHILLPPRAASRQRLTHRHRSPLQLGPAYKTPPSRSSLAASLTLAFFSWAHHQCHFTHTDATVREAARVLIRAHSLRFLWQFLRSEAHVISTATVTAVIVALGEEGYSDAALAAFYRIKQFHCVADTHCHNAVIAALCRGGKFMKARFLLEQMELPGARCPPDTYTYTVLITYYCRHAMRTGCRKAIRRRIWEANWLFRRMIFNGLVPDVVTYNCLIDGLCKTYRVERALELFDQMCKKGCVPNRVTYDSFVRYYSAVNEADKAVGMMRDMVARGHGVATSSTYTPIIHSFCESGRVREARELLIEMVDRGHVPREYTYKLVKSAVDVKEEGWLPEEICRRIDDGIRERFSQVMKVKPIMRPVTRSLEQVSVSFV